MKRSILLAAVSAGAACSTSTEPSATITQLTPPVAYNDGPVAMKIQGGPFRPAYRFDAVSGEATVDLRGWSAALAAVAGSPAPAPADTGLADLAWQDAATLTAALPAGLPAGVYDLHVRDPRGQEATLPRAFVSLGADGSAPLITMTAPSPGSVVAGGTAVAGTLSADDGVGILASLSWIVSGGGATLPSQTCALLPGAHQVDCPLAFKAPAGADALDTMTIDATATDRAGLTASRRFDFRLASAPIVTGMDPLFNLAQFSTRVRVFGENFVGPANGQPGTIIVADGVLADPITFVSPNEVDGVLPAHDPGSVSVVVRTGNAEADAPDFTYVAIPTIRAVSPSSGPAAGGTIVAIVGDGFRPETQIVFVSKAGGAYPVVCTHYVSANRIEVTSPAGAGLFSVVAQDPVSGPGRLDDCFSYDAAEDGGADAGTPACALALGDGGT